MERAASAEHVRCSAQDASGNESLTNVRQALVAFQWEGSLEAAGGSLTNSPT